MLHEIGHVAETTEKETKQLQSYHHIRLPQQSAQPCRELQEQYSKGNAFL